MGLWPQNSQRTACENKADITHLILALVSMSTCSTRVRMISRFVASSRLPTPAQPLLQALHVESVPADRHRRMPFKLAIEIRDSSFCPSHPRRELVFFDQTCR
jgi:hypothetical protein